jgi:hypothetical protein
MEHGQFSVIIKRGTMEFKLDRTNLLKVEETYDGVVFNFKDGLMINVVDNNMPTTTKQLVKNADSFANGNIVFDLNNYSKPASLSLS